MVVFCNNSNGNENAVTRAVKQFENSGSLHKVVNFPASAVRTGDVLIWARSRHRSSQTKTSLDLAQNITWFEPGRQKQTS